MNDLPSYDINQSAMLVDMTTCLNHYRLSTPGIYVCIHPKVQLTDDVTITPSLITQVNHGPAQQCQTGEESGDYDRFYGPPNFVFDVFRKDHKETYESRRALFEQPGVIEYVAWFTNERKPRWNRLVDSSYEVIDEDETDLIKSSALPGLWMPITAMAHQDMFSILAKIAQGVTRREHHDFMNTVWKKR